MNRWQETMMSLFDIVNQCNHQYCARQPYQNVGMGLYEKPWLEFWHSKCRDTSLDLPGHFAWRHPFDLCVRSHLKTKKLDENMSKTRQHCARWWSGTIVWYGIFISRYNLREQGSWGLHGAHLGTTGPRWAPCWPHERCYQGWLPKFLPV